MAVFKLEKSDKSVLDAFYDIIKPIREGFFKSKILKFLHLDSGESIYCLCFAIFYLYCYVDSTMIHFPHLVRLLCVGGVATFHFLMWFKIIVLDTEDKWDLVRYVIPSVVLSSVAQLALTYGGFHAVVFFYMFIVGARKVDFRKVAMIAFVIGALTTIIVTALSPLGLYTSIVIDWTELPRKRYAFGFIYPTDYAAHICFLCLLFFWLRKGEMKWFDILLYAGCAGFIYYFCIAKVDTACILMIVAFGLLFKFDKCRSILMKFKLVFILAIPVIAAFMILLTACFDQNNSFYQFIHTHFETVYSRLYTGKASLDEYGTNLFGSWILEMGLGGSAEHVAIDEYTFIDVSYLRMIIKHGLLAFAFIITWYPYMISRRLRRGDLVTAAVWLIIAINSAIAHHFIDFSYNVFILMLFADLTKYDADRERIALQRAQRKNRKLKTAS